MRDKKLSKHPLLSFCSYCGAEMIEDVWEVMHMLPNNGIQQEIIYPAWVCSKFCGFYVRINK